MGREPGLRSCSLELRRGRWCKGPPPGWFGTLEDARFWSYSLAPGCRLSCSRRFGRWRSPESRGLGGADAGKGRTRGWLPAVRPSFRLRSHGAHHSGQRLCGEQRFLHAYERRRCRGRRGFGGRCACGGRRHDHHRRSSGAREPLGRCLRRWARGVQCVVRGGAAVMPAIELNDSSRPLVVSSGHAPLVACVLMDNCGFADERP
mmetsp:Transcript_12673/g.44829  ORF Transcript_12673/g.44829 Transcript_12673/m.44829 type:complete len:204 (-) Transcript_12673:636-1247(-)